MNKTRLRRVGVLTLLLLLAVPGIFIAARFHDGPLEIISGGRFKTGELQAGPEEPDWTFLRDYQTVEFQLLEPARSRTTYIMLYDGRIFVPSYYMNSIRGKLWKHWPMEAEEDGRALLRVDGKLYERRLVRVQEHDTVLGIVTERARKYGGSPADLLASVQSGDLWLFELQSRGQGASGR